MNRLVVVAAFAGNVVATLAAAPAGAQLVTCRAPAGSNEAILLTTYAVPLAFGAALPQPTLQPGEVALALEATWLPTPSAAVRRSDACFTDKSENTALSPVLPRPRVAIGLPAGVTFEASLLPPITIADATPRLAGVALAHNRPLGARGTLLARAHGTIGHVEGPVTCAREALLSTPGAPCFGDSPSTDQFAPNSYGAEVMFARPLGAQWTVSAGGGVLQARPRFTVNFTNGFGVRDETLVRVDRTAATLSAAVARELGPRASLGLVAFSVPGTATTVRLTGQWQLR
jgi:hypothetical protein